MNTYYTNADNMNEDQLVIRRNNSNASVADNLVDASKRTSSWVVDSCGLCTNYMDKQVQYEIMSQRIQGAAEAATAAIRPSGTFDIQGAIASCHQNFDDIKATAASMFDEQSVVDSVELR